jgi:hypothetical protein
VTGVTGATGATGSTGTTGPELSTFTYKTGELKVVTANPANSTINTRGSFQELTATSVSCNSGEKAIGGGILTPRSVAASGRGIAVMESVPNSTTGPTGWNVKVQQTNYGKETFLLHSSEVTEVNPTEGRVQAYVICTSQPVIITAGEVLSVSKEIPPPVETTTTTTESTTTTTTTT